MQDSKGKLRSDVPTPPPQVGKGSSGKILLIMIAMTLLTVGIIILAAGAAYLYGASRTPSIKEQRQTIVQEGEVIADVAEEVGQSVVSIVAEQQQRVNSFYYGPQTRTSQAAGTGVIVDESGHILTNKHVVPESATSIQIVMSDGTRYSDVKLVGRDPLNDLAILKVESPKDFKPARFADSDAVRTGQKVIAIGNALGQFQNTVTSGIISGMGRPIAASSESGGQPEQLTNLFQTDAAINSGNSGGPLLNYNGEVIGINTAVAANAENIGFAIPINEAKGIITSAQETGRVVRPYIGVRFTMLTPDIAKELELSIDKGAYISRDSGSIVSGSPAEAAGLKPGDVITKVNDIVLSDTVSLASAVGRFRVDEEVRLTVIRDSKEQVISVKLSEAN